MSAFSPLQMQDTSLRLSQQAARATGVLAASQIDFRGIQYTALLQYRTRLGLPWNWPYHALHGAAAYHSQ
jgi:hypothetical protein